MTRAPGTIARKLGARFEKDATAEPCPAATPHRTAAETLGRHLLETVMTTAQVRRFRHEPRLRVVIEAPTPAWVEPLRSAAAAMAAWQVAVGMDGTPIPSRETSAAEGAIAQALGAGCRIVAVSHAPWRHLPPSLVAGADMIIRTGHPTPAVIRKAIRDATGVAPGTTSARLGDRLDFFDLASAIRAGSDLSTCLRKLGSATANRAVADRFPSGAADLASLHGYGDGATWALRLVADIDAWRRGDGAAFPGPDRHAVLAGPNGTGKSSLAAGIAASAGLPLVATSVTNWFAGGTSFPDGVLRRAQAAFARATDAAPAIVLLDGIDAIPEAGQVGAQDADDREAIFSAVTRFLDAIASGEPSSPKLAVIATASLANALDPALVRLCRLTRIIEITMPDDEAIPAIFRQHLGSDLDGIDLGEVTALSSGSTGATIAGWVRAARRRARIARRDMTVGDLVEEASAPENRSPGSLLRAEVRETFRAVDVRADHSTQIRPTTVQPAVGPAERLRIPSPPGKVARTGIGSKARIVSVLAGRAPGTTTGARERTGVHRPGRGK
ncbi:hypothetical protein ASF22_20065 [Methylobacterium sp. Leaf87]|uniref:AAA family ATPase n=1 Tax=Methylobacterium sp. Leaf87 TaxID=1736243 RepID=UPI0006F979C0|nr:ATP-binding protein [Methylobacterium sp. Leaf87]KQO67638.1 hypothetical protein ASF22_20065 [Methylobacterium sp. Leaf87]